MKKYASVIALVFLLASCYRMPDEGEVSTIPTTNNPNVIRSEYEWKPGVEF